MTECSLMDMALFNLTDEKQIGWDEHIQSLIHETRQNYYLLCLSDDGIQDSIQQKYEIIIEMLYDNSYMTLKAY